MRTNDVGPISKATFEESIDILINAAIHTEKEKMQGVSASIIVGNRAPIGTGFFDLCIDEDKLTVHSHDSSDQSIQLTEDIYSPEEWL
jgi:DNA-directed RNA polymerase II subunit RPB1